jgi:choline transport protein
MLTPRLPGPLDTAIGSSAPYLLLFQNTGSNAVAFVLLIILFVLIFLGNITALATTSREVWAFSRDKGFPFSKWISKVSSQTSHGITALPSNLRDEPQTKRPRQLSLPYLRRSWCPLPNQPWFQLRIQYHRLLTLIALLSTYMISIGCVLRKRLLREELPIARWSLGRFGTSINAFAFLYSGFAIVFSCFPPAVPVTPSTVN